jgi:hypothetical protein
MARKKRISFGERLGHVFSDFADAASVAATGSQLGILERAAEEEIGAPAVERPQRRRAAARKRKTKAARKRKASAAPKKKKVASRKAGRPKKKPARRR